MTNEVDNYVTDDVSCAHGWSECYLCDRGPLIEVKEKEDGQED